LLDIRAAAGVAAWRQVAASVATEQAGLVHPPRATGVLAGFAFMPEANDLEQEFLAPVHPQAGHAFKVTVGEDRHCDLSFEVWNLRECFGRAQDRQVPLRQRKKSVKWASAAPTKALVRGVERDEFVNSSSIRTKGRNRLLRAAGGYRHAVNAGLDASE
jgi:hypothetical protein